MSGKSTTQGKLSAKSVAELARIWREHGLSADLSTTVAQLQQQPTSEFNAAELQLAEQLGAYLAAHEAPEAASSSTRHPLMSAHYHCPECGISLSEESDATRFMECVCGESLQRVAAIPSAQLAFTFPEGLKHCLNCHATFERYVHKEARELVMTPRPNFARSAMSEPTRGEVEL